MAIDGKRRSGVYRWIKIGGLLSFLPFVMAAGPLGGYFLGDYLEKRFGSPSYVSLIFITLGFIGSVAETVKIVKAALQAEKKG
ncbi:MAG: AtpZ/AtpI family protein [Candidatus Omnitrophota bacterium]|nr:AtpZ/AtpI family protein [Candidatus Omnitrophota bacterium]